MEINESPLAIEINKVVADGEKDVFASWEVEFKIKDTFNGEFPLTERDKKIQPKEEKEDKIYKPLKLFNIDFERDYEKAYGEYIKIQTLISYGQWVKILFIARDHLECTLRRIPLKENKEINEEKDILEVTYDCLPQMTTELQVEVSKMSYIDKFELDNTVSPLMIDFELLDKGLEDLRKVTIGAIGRKVKPEDMIKVTLVKNTKELELNGESIVDKVSVVETDNKEEREHILIPHATKLLDVPNYIHHHCGGVYNSGINTFYQNNELYVYPIFNIDRFEKEERTLTVIKVPENRVMELERSFKIDDKRLTVLAFTESNFSDFTKSKFLKKGNGVRYADSRMFMNKITKTKDNKSIVKRNKVNHEYITKDLEKQNTVYISHDRIHSNPFKQFSEQSSSFGGIYTFVWQHADINLLYPGMPVRILYSNQEDIKELRGVLLKVHGVVQALKEGIFSSDHLSQAALFIFANFHEDTQ